MTYNIAIDGPAGAGKSTIAKRVAKELSFIYVDTGAMYRAIALYLLRKGTNTDSAEAVSSALEEIRISIAYENGEQQVLLNGENVSGLIRTEEVGNMASKAAALPCVREKLLELQRELARSHDVVMDGRDIGTNILPEAQLKIYLTASADTRAKRRYSELREKGQNCDFDEIREDIIRRDEQDTNRTIAPLRQAADAVYLDSSDMTIDEVTERIKSLCREHKI
ncbi:MAG: (d)CMP kinase [Eubacteriales bacterium]|nr:(d)CMP kinase [Eubacteriales bacterium]